MNRLIQKSLLVMAATCAAMVSSWADEDSFSISPVDSSIGPLGDTRTVSISAAPSARWNAESLVPWITINGTGRGGGNGTVSYSVDRNPSNELREGQIRINQAEIPKPWSIETIDSDGFVGQDTSLSFAPSGNPAISYYDSTNRDLKYASFDGENWITETIDSEGNVGQDTSLSFSPSGHPTISYYNTTDGNLKYASFDGQDWTTETIDSEGNVGSNTSLSFDPSGNPAISYYDRTNRDLKYASFDGENWITETIDSLGTVGLYTSLSFDPSGNPAISYYDSTNRDLKYASFDGENWITETIDSEGNVGSYPSLSFSPSGHPAISYYNTTDGNLKYASFDGENWTTETIDSEGSVGFYSSLSFNPTGYPAISYYDGTNRDLKYASFDGQDWTTETIDSEGTVGQYPSLSFSPSGHPAISYLSYLDSNGDLKFVNKYPEIPAVTTYHTVTQDPIDPNADTDGDGLKDIIETNTGTFISASDTGTDPIDTDTDNDGLSDSVETATGTYASVQDAGTNPHNPDTDGDGLIDSIETNTGNFVSRVDIGSNPHKFDSDSDGLSDNYEINTSRYAIVSGFFRWEQARADAITRNGTLATFASEAEWLEVLDVLGEGALDNYTGLWIGATDSEEEGKWKWITGEAFDFNNWANGQPDNVAGADHAEVSGGFGAAPGLWFDTPEQAIRDGYILEATTDPNDPDTDGDGLSDGHEAGTDRFSTVSGFFRWEQARADAIAKGGTLATFTTEQEWLRALDSLGEGALNEFSGLWIGATDAEEEGDWKWITGEAFDFNNWANGQPDNVAGADHAEVSGGFGAAPGLWFDTPAQAIRDGYILEKGHPTDPTNPDTDGDGFSDGQEIAAGSNPNDANSTPGENTSSPFNLSINATLLPSGAIDQLTLSFPSKIGKSYRIEESTNLKTWRTRESAIDGTGDTIQRSFPASSAIWFLRASEE